MEPRALARLLAGILLAGLLFAGPALPGAALSFNDSGSADQLAERISAAMTDDELLGQVLFLGWQGIGPSKDILAWISERGIGGIKIFPRNVSDLPGLARDIAGMQRLARRNRFAIPLFVATDQEGGWVRQIKDETSVSPGNLALGASNMPIDAYRTGFYLGKELAALGINMDFAPTADTYSNPEASVIGPRSFGSDPATTGLLSAAYARGMQSAGVVTTAKHFPGHGSADSDSHGHLPKIDVTLDQLLNRDLVPYRILIREGIPAIMTGHLAFPRILGNLTPSSLSPFLLEDVLRNQLGFKGLLITDDMEMEGVLSGGLDTPEACRAALEAGNNMVLISHTPRVQEKTWSYLRASMKSDPRLRADIRDSARRVLLTKLTFFRDARALLSPNPAAVQTLVPAVGARSFFFQSAARAVTLLAGARVPLRLSARSRVLLVGQYSEFLSEGKRRYPNADTFLYPFSPFYTARKEDVAAVRAKAQAYDTIIFCLANFNSLEVLQGLAPLGNRVIVISTLSPVYLAEARWLRTVIAVYGDGVNSFRAGFAALAGDFVPTGKLPVSFPGQDSP